MKYLVLLGRALFTGIFLIAAPQHFGAGDIAYAAAMGVPFPHLLVPASGLIAIVGALSILTGYKAKWGAWLIVLFLVPVTFTMHKFWGLSDPQAAMINQIMFMKNMSMLGGALLIAYFGSGPLSLKA